MPNKAKFRLLSLYIVAMFAFSSLASSFAYAAPLADTAKDWQYVNGNSWGWNYSPETQINKSSVKNLEVKWIFPLQGKSSVSPAMSFIQSGLGGEGSTTPPIVRNGKVFVTTNYMRTIAIDAKTGKEAWRYDYVINITDVQNRIPVSLGPRPHLHGFRYWEGGNMLLLNGLACDFYGIDVDSGKNALWVKDLCKDIPGNIYAYYKYAAFAAASSLANIGTYDKGKQFVFILPGSMHATIFLGDSRHVTLGIDMNTSQIKWRIFSYPPQDRPSKDWAFEECSIGYFQTFPCQDVAAKNRAQLEWDWTFPNQNPSPYGGVTANWGQAIVDEDTGIFYTQTGNQGPFTNVSLTPGPRLYGSTIMAIDMNAGKRIWWLQPFPHDPYDYDCNWGGILADVQGLGKVYMKGCKEGRLYVMNATNGKPLYVKDVVEEQVQWAQITSAASQEHGAGGVKYHLTDPYSDDLRNWTAITDGKHCTAPCNVYPFWSNGIFATDMSYDGNSTLYHYASALQVRIVKENPYIIGQSVTVSVVDPKTNTTIVARDIATGNVKWRYFYPIAQQRSHMVVTPELLFTGFTDGYMRFFDKNTGTVLNEINLGSDMRVGVTTGQDSDGKQLIFTIVGTGASAITPATPGTVVALGLSAQAPGATVTTATTTVTTTTTSVSVSTTTAAATTITSTIPATTTTITSTLPGGQTTTITSIIPAQTITTTIPGGVTTITSPQAGGLPVEITYAVAAIAIIAIIAAAFLAMRKR